MYDRFTDFVSKFKYKGQRGEDVKEGKGNEMQEWNIRFLRVLWIVSLIAFAAALVLYFKFDDPSYSRESYFKEFVLTPTLAQFILCIIMELFVRLISPHLSQKASAVVIALGLEFECGVLVIVHNSVDIMAVLFVIALMLATVYQSRLILVLQSVLACFIYVFNQFVVIPNQKYMPENDAVVYSIIFIALLVAAGVWMNSLVSYQLMMSGEVEKYKKRAKEREQQVQVDALTGCWNYKAFVNSLESRLKALAASPGKCVLVLFDIDGLARINEQYGHECGDGVILKLVEMIKHSVRNHDYIARYNGEEFMLVLNDATIEIGHNIARRIQEEFAAYAFAECGSEKFSISVGVVEWLPNYANMIDFVSKAEQALRTAKMQGYGQISIYQGKEAGMETAGLENAIV